MMSALPYLATVIVLVLISRARTGGITAPAASGNRVRARSYEHPGAARRGAHVGADRFPAKNGETMRK